MNILVPRRAVITIEEQLIQCIKISKKGIHLSIGIESAV